jgi:hypothetical protein
VPRDCRKGGNYGPRWFAGPWASIYGDIGNGAGEAGLGRCALGADGSAQAGVQLRQALEIFQRIGGAEAADLLAELKSFIRTAWGACPRDGSKKAGNKRKAWLAGGIATCRITGAAVLYSFIVLHLQTAYTVCSRASSRS